MALDEQKEFMRLERMLRYCRPRGTASEKAFIDQFIRPLGVEQDQCGNLIKRIGKNPKIMFSSHTDSVHRVGGSQDVVFERGVFGLPRGKKGRVASGSNCLGADDAAGVWIMANMIRQKKPGLYIFHRGEESGGIGSTWLTKNTPGRVNGIRAAIAFDRRGFGDVITHQWGGRCASDEFAKSLAEQIGENYKPCPYGSFTDTANYTGLVGECTNLSVGYLSEHTPSECLSFPHALFLLKRMLALDVSKLVFKRQPGESEPRNLIWDEDGYYYGVHTSYRHNRAAPAITTKGNASTRERFRYDKEAGAVVAVGTGASLDERLGAAINAARSDRSVTSDGDMAAALDSDAASHGVGSRGDYRRMRDLIRDNPDEMADLMEELGYDYGNLSKDLYMRGAALRS